MLRDCSVTAAESGLAQHRMGCGLRRAEQDTHPGAAWARGERKRPQPAPEQVWRHSPDTLYPKERQNRPKMYPAWGENAYPGSSPVQGSASPGSRNKNASDPAQPQETPATPSSPWGWRSPLQTTPPAQLPPLPILPKSPFGHQQPTLTPPCRRWKGLSINPQHLPGEIGPVPSAKGHSCFPGVSESPQNPSRHPGQGAVGAAGISAARRLCSPRREGGTPCKVISLCTFTLPATRSPPAASHGSLST